MSAQRSAQRAAQLQRDKIVQIFTFHFPWREHTHGIEPFLFVFSLNSSLFLHSGKEEKNETEIEFLVLEMTQFAPPAVHPDSVYSTKQILEVSAPKLFYKEKAFLAKLTTAHRENTVYYIRKTVHCICKTMHCTRKAVYCALIPPNWGRKSKAATARGPPSEPSRRYMRRQFLPGPPKIFDRGKCYGYSHEVTKND